MGSVLHIIDPQTPVDMLDQLSLLVKKDDLIVSIGPAPKYPWFNLPVRSVHCPLGIPQLSIRRIAKLADSTEIVHAWSLAAGLTGAGLARGARIGILLSLPCAPHKEDLPQIARMVHNKGVHLSVPGRTVRAMLVRAGINESNVHVLPPPVESTGVGDPELRLRTRKSLGATPEHCLLLTPSQMVRGAGHKYASWAHAIVRQIHENILLLMPGGGPIAQRVKFFAATTGYDDDVFLPSDRFTRREVLAAADIALFLGSHDTGLAALAATMAAGVPIVASQTPAVTDWCSHDLTALLVKPSDPRAASSAILRLIEDPELRRSLGAAAQERARSSFDLTISRQRLTEIHSAAAFRGPY